MMTDCECCGTATLNQGELFNRKQKKYKKTNNTGCLEKMNYYKLINEPLREGFAVKSSALASTMASSSAIAKKTSISSSSIPLSSTRASASASAKVSTSAKATGFAYSSKPASASANSISLLGSDVAQSYLAQLQILDTQFNSLVEQYNTAQASFNSTTDTYISNEKTKNPYLGTNITLNTNNSYYITGKGVAKMYDTSTTSADTMGNNGCPATSKSINASALPSQVSSGTAMVSGQSCGNEGQNVYVSSVVANPTASYIGCYQDSTSAPAMTPINDNAQIYNYQTCMQSALDNGSTYFGLQNADSTTGVSECMVSTNISTAEQYGKATSNCPTGTDNNIYGGTNINAVYKTPEAIYVDTFVDNPDRSMTSVNNGSQTFTYSTCQQAAIDANNKFFGLQAFNASTQKAQCFIGNNYDTVSSYGSANANKTIKGKDGKSYGGKWANAVYQITNMDGNYLGCYQDNATSPAMTAINGGSNTYSFDTCQQEAINGNNKYFALQGGTDGTSQCFVSNQLSSVKQYGISRPCSKLADGNVYGNASVNAIYQLDQIGTVADVGKVGYVDENTLLSEYPSSMLAPGSVYNKIANYDSPGNDISGNPIQNSSVQNCTASCNANSSCVGFAFDTSTNNCSLKTNGAYPKGQRVPNNTTNYFVRQPAVKNSNSCSKIVSNVDSLQWANYPASGSSMTPTTSCGYGQDVQQTQATLSDLETQIQATTSQILDIISKMESQNTSVNQSITTTNTSLDKYIAKYKQIGSKITQNNAPTQNIIVQDSDIYVLQENYNYMFWSILAIVSIIIAMNLSRPN
jgi:hypothetical protein